MSNANADNNPEIKQPTRHSTQDWDKIETDQKKGVKKK
jgi:hypothetical protein